jgi:hypothetical protein
MNALDYLTAFLALATAVLAYETRRMAAATKKMVDVTAAPYLAVLRVDLQPVTKLPSATNSGGQGYKVLVFLKNPGQVRVTFEVRKIVISLERVDYPAANIDNRYGVLHPEEETTFPYPFFQCSTPLHAGMSGTVDFQADFWVVENDKKSLEVSAQFNIDSLTSTGHMVSSRFISGPKYTD